MEGKLKKTRRLLALLLALMLLAPANIVTALAENVLEEVPAATTVIDAGPKAPEAEESKAPEAQESKAPEAQESKAPEAEESKAPEAEESKAPEAEESKAPEAEESKAPEAEESKAPEAEESKAPEAEESQAPEAEESKAPETEESQDPEETPAPSETPEVTEEPTEEPTPEPIEDLSGVSVRFTAVDEKGDAIGGYLNAELAKGDYSFASALVEVKGYTYIETLLNGAKLDALRYSEDDLAWLYTAGGETAKLTEDAALTVRFSENFVKWEYEYHDSYIDAVVTVEDARYLPDDAKLKVTPVKNGGKYDYNAYMDALNDHLDKEYTEDNTLLYDFAILAPKKGDDGLPTGEWEEIQPAKGSVKVKVTFKRNQISDGLGAESDQDVSVVHLPLKKSALDGADTTAQAGNLNASDVKVQPLADNKTDVDLDGHTDDVTFTTNSFSVYAFTVDFHFDGTDYSIPGMSQILLSDLIVKLNIKNGGALLDVADVARVEFTDERLVTVEQVSGLIAYNGVEGVDVGEKDFLLSSKQAFGSEEKLTIRLENGEKIEVGVTDDPQAISVYQLGANSTPTLSQVLTAVGGQLDLNEDEWYYYGDGIYYVQITIYDSNGNKLGTSADYYGPNYLDYFDVTINHLNKLDYDTTGYITIKQWPGQSGGSYFPITVSGNERIQIHQTVDHHYRMLLSDLIQNMQIKKEGSDELLSVDEVQSVSFDNHDVTVEQVSGEQSFRNYDNSTGNHETVQKNAGDKDFLLSSLTPFSDKELVNFVLTNGEELKIAGEPYVYKIGSNSDLSLAAVLTAAGEDTTIKNRGGYNGYSAYYNVWVEVVYEDSSVFQTSSYKYFSFTNSNYDVLLSDLYTIPKDGKAKLRIYQRSDTTGNGWVTFSWGTDYIWLEQDQEPVDHTYRTLLSDLNLTKNGVAIDVDNVVKVEMPDRESGTAKVTITEKTGAVNFTNYTGDGAAEVIDKTISGDHDYLLESKQPISANDKFILTMADGTFARFNIREYTYAPTSSVFTLQEMKQGCGWDTEADVDQCIIMELNPKYPSIRTDYENGLNPGEEGYDGDVSIIIDDETALNLPAGAYLLFENNTTGDEIYVNLDGSQITLAKKYIDAQFVYEPNGKEEDEDFSLTIVGLNPEFAGGAITISSTSGVIIGTENETYPVTAIADNAFSVSIGYDGNPTEASLPNTKITKVTFANDEAITLGDRAFQNCEAITAIDTTGAGGLVLTGASNFSGCTALTEATLQVNGGLTNWLFNRDAALATVTFKGSEPISLVNSSDGAQYFFDDCSALEEVNAECGITAISGSPFSDSKLSKLTAGGTTKTEIGKQAFSSNNPGAKGLTIDINGGISNIDEYAFYSTDAKFIRIEGAVDHVAGGTFYRFANKDGFGVVEFVDGVGTVDKNFMHLYDGADVIVYFGASESTAISETFPRGVQAVYFNMPKASVTGADGITCDAYYTDGVDSVYLGTKNTDGLEFGTADHPFGSFAALKAYLEDSSSVNPLKPLLEAKGAPEVPFSQQLADDYKVYINGPVKVIGTETWDGTLTAESSTASDPAGAALTDGENAISTPAAYAGSGSPLVLYRDPGYTAEMVNVTGTLTLKNVVLDGNKDNVDAAEAIIKSSGTLNIQDGAVLRNNNNTTSSWNGGIYSGGAVYSSKTVNMTGGEISGNEAVYGGGICLHGSSASLNMSGGTIKDNAATGYYWYTSASGTTSGLLPRGGGVAITYNAKMTLSGGTISGNEAGTGGGIEVGGEGLGIGGTLTMTSGTVSDNTSSWEGGGICVESKGLATISGGAITGNTSQNGEFGGGGIYVNGGRNGVKDGELIIPNGVVTGNSADSYGGGIAGCGTSTVKVFGGDTAVAVYGNSASKGKDIFLSSTQYANQSGGTSGTTMTGQISPYMSNGTEYLWYNEETGETMTNEDLALITKTVYMTAKATGPKPSGGVRISGNHADTKGGGIGTNGKVTIGSEPSYPEQDVYWTPDLWKIMKNRDMASGEKFTVEVYQQITHEEPINWMWSNYSYEDILKGTATLEGADQDEKTAFTFQPIYLGKMKKSDIGKKFDFILIEKREGAKDDRVLYSQSYILEIAEVYAVMKSADEYEFRARTKYYYENDLDANGKPVTGIMNARIVRKIEPDEAGIRNYDLTTDVSATKAWKNLEGTVTPPAGASVVFEVFADGEATGKRITLDGTVDENGEDEAWVATWTGLDAYRKDEDGDYIEDGDDFERIEYTVKEITGYPGFTADATEVDAGGTITNDEDSTFISATKVWDDANDQDGLRKAVTLHLMKKVGSADAVAVQGADKTIPKGATGAALTVKWENLPTHEGGVEIQYSVTEDKVTGYTTAITGTAANGYKVTNTHKPEKTEISATKRWNDAGLEQYRPESITFILSADGKEIDRYTVTAKEAWKHTFTGLDKYRDKGTAIVYSVAEAPVSGYTASASGAFTVVNTPVTQTKTVHASATVNKVDPSGKALKGATFGLYDGETLLGTYGGAAIDSFEIRTQDLTAQLPEAGKTKTLTLKETSAPAGYIKAETAYDVVLGASESTAWNAAHPALVTTTTYTVTVSGGATLDVPNPTVTPTPTPEPTPEVVVTPTPVPMTQIGGQKVWTDDSNAHQTRPESITVRLYADGVAVNATPTWTKEGDVWTYSFGDQPQVNAAGQTISYTVTEDPVEGYTTTISGMTINNKLIPHETENFTELKGVKTWVDDNDAAGMRPESITVHLLQDDVEIDSKVVTAADRWSYSFGQLPVDDGYGNTYTYTLHEDGVPGYFAQINGMDVTNTMLPPDTRRTPPDDDNNGDTPKGNVPPVHGVTHQRAVQKLATFTEEEFDEMLDMLDYDTPLWGSLLGTGDETPVYPWVFGGLGLLAAALLIFDRKRRRSRA